MINHVTMYLKNLENITKLTNQHLSNLSEKEKSYNDVSSMEQLCILKRHARIK